MKNEMNIMNISGIECYEKDGTAYLKLETVARGLGFTDEKNGIEYVRWNTVKKYLRTIGFSQEVAKTQFIPESIFYRLAMKAKNEVAEAFQKKIAEDILPTLRRTGHYEIPKPKNEMELLEHFFGAMKEIDAKVDIVAEKTENLEKGYNELKNDTPLLGVDMDRVTYAVKRKGVELLGGKTSNAYKDRSLRKRTYNDIYQGLKRNFGVSSYKAIKRCECETAVKLVNDYKLPYVLETEIADTNAQITMQEGK